MLKRSDQVMDIQSEALAIMRSLGHRKMTTGHLLLATLDSQSHAGKLLRDMGIDRDFALETFLSYAPRGALASRGPFIPHTPQATTAMIAAERVASTTQHPNEVFSADLLFGLVNEPVSRNGNDDYFAVRLLEDVGVNIEGLRETVWSQLGVDVKLDIHTSPNVGSGAAQRTTFTLHPSPRALASTFVHAPAAIASTAEGAGR